MARSSPTPALAAHLGATTLPAEIANSFGLQPSWPVTFSATDGATSAGPSFGAPGPARAIGPNYPTNLLLDRALTCAALGAFPPAIASLRMLTQRLPGSATAWRALGDLLALTGENAAAAAAHATADRQAAPDASEPPPADPRSRADLGTAERQILADAASKSGGRPRIFLRHHLFEKPQDAAAMRILAAHVVAAHEPERAKALLRRALQLAPQYVSAREDYAKLLMWGNHSREALTHLDLLTAQVPGNETYQLYRAITLVDLGDIEAGIKIYEALLQRATPRDQQLYISYANALRDVGRRADCARILRDCIAQEPGAGEAYWGLANLKFEPLSDADLAAMHAQLARVDLPTAQRFHFHYTLGHALEQRAEYGASFAHYAQGAKIRRENLDDAESAYDADELTALAGRVRGFFTPARMAARATPASRDAARGPVPIFIVGMPRSGSTLIEQILASHSQIEGLQELPEMSHVLMKLDTRNGTVARSAYPDCLDELDNAALAALGQEYLAACAVYRKTDKPYFIDKLPGNWGNVAFIKMILPHAKIIDARRHPMGACLGTFKQLIISGATFTYDLTDIGRRYRDYVDLMRYFDALLPGFVHRVFYEDMVTDTETRISAMLAYCGVDFEPQCLRFWETERAVRTPSSEQVRRPITRANIDQWRHFEPWLDELKQALGPALANYRLPA